MNQISTLSIRESKEPDDGRDMLHVLSSTMGMKALKCPFTDVSQLFTNYFREQTFTIGITDLENELFILSKEHHIHMSVISSNLTAFEALHPLLMLAARGDIPAALGRVEREFDRLVASAPGIVLQYKWTIRAYHFLNNLAIKWGLLTVHNFLHRFDIIPGTIVFLTQLSECSRLDDRCFLPDILYVAVAPRKEMSEVAKDACLRVRVMLQQLFEILLTINKDIDFSSTHEVTDFLFRRGRMTSDASTSRVEVAPDEKRAVATRLGLHLLALPPWWKCECLYTEEDRLNMLLRAYLKYFCKEYCELESATARPNV